MPGEAGEGTSISGPGVGMLGGAGVGWPGWLGCGGSGVDGGWPGSGSSRNGSAGVPGVDGGVLGSGVPGAGGGVSCIYLLLALSNALERRLFLGAHGLPRRASLL